MQAGAPSESECSQPSLTPHSLGNVGGGHRRAIEHFLSDLQVTPLSPETWRLRRPESVRKPRDGDMSGDMVGRRGGGFPQLDGLSRVLLTSGEATFKKENFRSVCSLGHAGEDALRSREIRLFRMNKALSTSHRVTGGRGVCRPWSPGAVGGGGARSGGMPPTRSGPSLGRGLPPRLPSGQRPEGLEL